MIVYKKMILYMEKFGKNVFSDNPLQIADKSGVFSWIFDLRRSAGWSILKLVPLYI